MRSISSPLRIAIVGFVIVLAISTGTHPVTTLRASYPTAGATASGATGTSEIDLPTISCANLASGTPAATTATEMAEDNAVPGCLLAAVLMGTNETTGGAPDGIGVAFLSLDSQTGTLCYKITVSGITLPAKADHIHVGGQSKNGDVIIPFPTAPDASGHAEGCVPVDTGLAGKILADPAGYYVNIHTKDFVAGAVRGQLFSPLTADLEGANETASGATSGAGAAIVAVENTTVCYYLDVSGVRLPATAVQIHTGARGEAGDAVVPFPTAPDADGYASGCVPGVEQSLAQDILANPDNYYVNVQTSDFADGAIRGQLGR
ncbi:MAG TPA: CHRD domain-containing protein [Aggregatilineales bacterium]|nr:CHRD domain-containing protein [Aggregatilineales bacterium]